MTAALEPSPEVLAAPPRLVAETRADFRSAALALIERAALRPGAVAVVDFSGTSEVDAAGLGVMLLLQRRAESRGVTLHLAKVGSPVRYLFRLVRVEHIFTFTE